MVNGALVIINKKKTTKNIVTINKANAATIAFGTCAGQNLKYF